MSGLLTHLNTRLKLFEKVSLLLVVLVLVASVNIGVIYTYHQQAEQVGNSVNIAGQERMLSQRMARLATDVQQGENPDNARDRLQIASARFEENLAALEGGGTVPDLALNPDAAAIADRPQVTLRGETLTAAPDSLDPELAALRSSWDTYQPHVETVLTADPSTAEFQESVQYVNRQSDELLSRSDSVTAEFALVLRERRGVLVQVLLVLLTVDIGVALVGAVAARRYLGLPMADIARVGQRLARGETEPITDIGLPIDTSLPEHQQRSELAQLSHSFEAVQSYQDTASKQAQALARRDFDDPVLAERIPGKLGRSLDQMQTDLPGYIQELRTTTEKLEALIRASPAGILITGPKGQVKRWNPAAEDMFGWSADAVEGAASPAIPDGDRADFKELLSTAIVDGPISGAEKRWQTKTGDPVDVSLSVAPVPGGEETLDGVMIVVEDITDRKERERTLRQQRDELETLNRITDLVLTITQELVESSDQDRIERTVCSSLTESEVYESAWIVGRHGSDPFSVRTAATRSQIETGSEIDQSHGLYSLVSTAFESGQLQFETGFTGPVFEGVAFGENNREFAAIPLAYRETVFGVLVVATGREYAFSDREVSGLRTLGKTVGFAIDAITDKKLLFADTVVELTFEVTETTLPFVEPTTGLDCRLWLEGTVAGTKPETLDAYIRVENVSLQAFLDRLENEPGIIEVSPIMTESEPYRVKVSFGEDSKLQQFSQRQARLQAIELDKGSGTYTLEVPRNADIETTVGLVQSIDSNSEFIAKTEAERQAALGAESGVSVREVLTDRQFEVLKSAYFAGYFEWPRNSTIEDIAADLDLAGSTVNHHLRHAQLELAELLFESDGGRLDEGT
ncbi:MAG: PAS domain S-box protein [Halodesulfurarchaeum sp.]|nr:PAS domain S-box protein [Halodesulfurarchaeum sp.]